MLLFQLVRYTVYVTHESRVIFGNPRRTMKPDWSLVVLQPAAFIVVADSTKEFLTTIVIEQHDVKAETPVIVCVRQVHMVGHNLS